MQEPARSPFQKPPPKALEYKQPATEEPVNVTISPVSKVLFMLILTIIIGLGILLPVVVLMMLLK